MCCSIPVYSIYAHRSFYRRYPMARVLPPADYRMEKTDLLFLSWDRQGLLIKIYFTHLHPVFPVIHKDWFLAGYSHRQVQESGFSEKPAKTCM